VREVIPSALDGQRVDRVVAMLTGISRAEAAALVDDDAVLLDGVAVAGKVKVVEGQVIEVVGALPEPPAPPAADFGVEFGIVYVDDDLIVLDKPEGLVVHPGSGNETGTLVNGVLARYPEVAEVGDPARPGIVHRLDKGTSGLMLVARTPHAYDALVALLGARLVERRYLALVWGVPATATGLVDAPIGRSPREPTRMAVVADGRDARTRYELQRSYSSPVACAQLWCTLETGRTHQIRVHLSAIGHPIVGDPAYGGVQEGLSAPRPMLHAARLSFTHPLTGERLSFSSPVPADMAAVLTLLS
jgi:23S rRNA pseudouridine1911/1915/1917 synthase